VFVPTGTETAWNARLVAEDTTAGNGLRPGWRPNGGVLGYLTLQVLGPGGITSRDLGGVYRE
jgi:hypothetical protein